MQYSIEEKKIILKFVKEQIQFLRTAQRAEVIDFFCNKVVDEEGLEKDEEDVEEFKDFSKEATQIVEDYFAFLMRTLI